MDLIAILISSAHNSMFFIPDPNSLSAASNAFNALTIEFLCLSLIAIDAFPTFSLNILTIISNSSSIPSPNFAEIEISISLFFFKSDLLLILKSPSKTFKPKLSNVPLSLTKIRKSAFFALAKASSTPIFSILPIALRIPAVSKTVNGIPPKSKRASITSRVVPAIFDVIAAFRLSNALKRVDFPTFGAPIIATSKPDDIRSDMTVPSISFLNSDFITDIFVLIGFNKSCGISSSAKSIAVSIRALAEIKSFLQPPTTFPSAPLNTLCA